MRWGRNATDQAMGLMAGLPKEGEVARRGTVVFRNTGGIIVFRARHVLHTPGPLWVGHSRPILLVALVTLSLVVGPAAATAQRRLNLSWVDNSGGQAGFIIQRATGTGRPYTQIGQLPAGVVSYADTAVSFGTTYCYQVAAVEGAEVSAFSNVACGSPSGGFTLTTAKAGTGVGTVASTPAGITCGKTCSYTYPAGKAVTLTATPSSASTFSGWSGGGCSGTAPCTLVGNGSVTTTATFATAPPVPTVTSVTPNQGAPGAAVPVTITGSGFAAGVTVSVSGTGVTVSNVAMLSTTQVTATLTLASGAALGTRSVTVANVSGTGVTVSNVAMLSTTQVTAMLTLASGAALGTRSVTVANAGGVGGTLTGGFTVVAPMTVSSAAPTQGAAGATVPVTITGSGFAAGATVSVSGTGVTSSTVTVGSATQLTATLMVASGAGLGARDVTVTNPGGGSGTLPGSFTVTAGTPTLQPVNVAARANGGVASASTSYSGGFPAAGANNGDRKGLNWGNGGGSNDAAGPSSWLQVTFNGSKTINEIDVFMVQDTYWAPVEPTQAMTFSLYGLTDFQIQYWTGAAWTTVPGGSVAGNNRVWR